MKNALIGITLVMLSSLVCDAQDQGKLENGNLIWRWQVADGRLTSTLEAKDGKLAIDLTSPGFQLTLGDGTSLKASDFQLVSPPTTEDLPVEPAAPTLAHHFAGRQLVLESVNTQHHLSAVWAMSLRDDSSYLQQSLTLRAVGTNVWLKDMILLDQKIPGAAAQGSVDGSPVVAGRFFCGLEHPMAQNTVTGDAQVQCSLARNAVLKPGETLTESLVLGIATPGQLRRSFLTYLERERTHPYRPFLHYNSWFDIAWDKQKFNEAQSLNVIEQFGHELVNERGVQMDSFLFDDGWDDSETLWHFHSGFPNGFTPLMAAAASYQSGIGVWISPFGGYDEARRRRLEYGSQQGYETNASGFSLAGPKYYEMFRGICRDMIQKYGVNQFKFDGLAAGDKASQSGLTRDGDAMLQLVTDLRVTDPNIYINQTTGTWPSPFWLLNVDSTWRGGDDHNFQGQGSWCQRWMTYRDGQTFENIVKRAPLYPLNALMLHGVIFATNAAHLAAMSDADFSMQVREFFGSGTQLQELYLTPGLLDRQNWDDLAEAAKWSRSHADVLVDTHWIGGDPGQGQVYGWAAWSPRLGIVTLRNPTDKSASFSADLKTLFELPANAGDAFQLKSPWKNLADAETQPLEISARQTHLFNLRPFEVLTLEAKAISGDHRAKTETLGASTTTTLKSSTLQ
jgi:hypothetical protein